MSYTTDQKFEVAKPLADDLAEAYIASNFADMMVRDSREKAKQVRQLSESRTNQLDHLVQEYRATSRAIYSALWSLLDGYGGYKVVKDDEQIPAA